MNSLLLIKLTLSFIDATIQDITFYNGKEVAIAINAVHVETDTTISDLKYSESKTICNTEHQGDFINWTKPLDTKTCYLNLINKKDLNN